MPTFDDIVVLGGPLPDHGLQAWATGHAVWGLSGPGDGLVKTQQWELMTAPYDGTTIPGPDLGRIVRNKDSVFAPIAAGSLGGPGTGWNGYSGGGISKGGFGLAFFFTFNSFGGGKFPDGTPISAVVPSGHGVIVALVYCPAAAGAGGTWDLSFGTRGLGVPITDPAIATWHLLFPGFSTDPSCGMGGGGTTPPPPPVESFAGVDLLYWKEGYHIAQAGPFLQVTGKWHSDPGAGGGTIQTALVDGHEDCTEPKLSHPYHGPPLGITYRRGTGTSAAIFRQESYDYGLTWRADPEPNKAYKSGGGGLKHAVEVWNERTGERLLLYNDQTNRDAQGALTGKGAIKVDIVGPDVDEATGLMKKVDTFAVTEPGALADDSSFGAIFVRDVGAIDCVVLVAGNARVYRSHDDGRTWTSLA